MADENIGTTGDMEGEQVRRRTDEGVDEETPV